MIKLTVFALMLLLAHGHIVSAAETSALCQKTGYTISTINGVFTDEEGARTNQRALFLELGEKYNGQKINYEYLLNPTHFGGIADLVDSAVQKVFDNEVVGDYDLIEMINDASQKVQTQKLLLVAHSQGNFYANSFYDVVADQAGGISKQSIGVYSVATPSGRVAGDGEWLTSDSDKVIASTVGRVPFRKIKAPNTHIVLQPSDDPNGHNFTEVYLKYRSKEIVTGVKTSLDRLTNNTAQDENMPCISPPKLTLSHKLNGAVFAVADTVINTTGGALTASYKAYENIAIWGYNTTVAAASAVRDTVTGLLATASSADNSASVILTTQSLPQQGPQPQPQTPRPSSVVTIPATNLAAAPTIPSVQLTEVDQSLASETQQQQSLTDQDSIPKLVFVGSQNSGLTFGGGTIQQEPSQILGSTVEIDPVPQEAAPVIQEETTVTSAQLPAPALSVSQCAQTLATDGCLLATTTVRFEWPDIVGADYYLLNKNGTNATTTDTTFDIEIKDFSNYMFGINSVGVNGEMSATSTQKVSVATIPIAINEIAWMGTKANTNDEWFEIKNNTTHTIDLSQWELNAKDGTPHVKLTGTIAPKEYLIFERTDDTAVNDVGMHQKFTGELENNGDQLVLSYASTTMDQTPDGAWVAGATSTRQTMERYSSREPGADTENWGTNLGDTRTQQERYDCYFRLDKQNKDTSECFTKGFIKNGTDADGNAVGGTPGAQNSVSTLINKGQDITSDFILTADKERYVIPDGGKVYVRASSTLTIEPGVTISFYGGQWDEKQILIKGKLDAQGTAENPIILNSFFPDVKVGGIHFSAGFGTSTMAHVRFENTNGVLMTDGSYLDIQDSQFVNNYAGIESDGKNTIIINNTSFDNTEEGPVFAYSGGVVSVASSTITNTIDGAAIEVGDNVFLNVASTTIDGVYDWANAGIDAYGSNVSIINSVIRNTDAEGISASNSNVSVEGLTVSNTMESGIYLYNSTSSIANTTIEGVSGYSGIAAVYGTLSIASSTIENVLNDGIGLYSASSTILNTVVENGTGRGVFIDGGTAEIIDTSVGGFGESGISVVGPTEPVDISGGEISGNAIGVDISTADSVIMTDVSVRDNGTSDADNIVESWN